MSGNHHTQLIQTAHTHAHTHTYMYTYTYTHPHPHPHPRAHPHALPDEALRIELENAHHVRKILYQ